MIYGLFWRVSVKNADKPINHSFSFRICRMGRAFDLTGIAIDAFVSIDFHVLFSLADRVHRAILYASSAVDAIVIYCSWHNVTTFLC